MLNDPLADSFLRDLIEATRTGDLERMDHLLSSGIRPDARETISGDSALHAAMAHHPELVARLLPFAVDPDAPRAGIGTPLAHVVQELGENPPPAVRQKLLQAMKELLAAGADPWYRGTDYSPVELARLHELPEIEALLLGKD